MPITLDGLRRLAVAQSLFPPTTLKRALHKFGFVQADPIRSPARAQDLILRHRVNNYHAGDLERQYSKLDIHEDFFINYGFVTSAMQKLMHPRANNCVAGVGGKRAKQLLKFIQERGPVHPREVNEHFSHGKATNYWGGSSNATTRLLDAMHYQGLLRVVGRQGGIRTYAVHQHGPGPGDKNRCRANIDALADIAIRIYAPLPGKTLLSIIRRLNMAAPQWQKELDGAFRRAKERLAHARIDSVDWYWPDKAVAADATDTVRLLAPFDPVVWDRTRFELLWDWAYRFEAYTPIHKRKLGYYALPLLWRNHIIGWGNLSVKNEKLSSEFGYVKSPPKDPVFKRELASELNRIKIFLGLPN
ncbi:MAG TPA: crosslink repair DNA glycosylase YcaQ family protein [Terriglobales bacterium]|nr:crosslink repair DNA glycosylase YcaQ family protein [Terriglobales bacterium]